MMGAPGWGAGPLRGQQGFCSPGLSVRESPATYFGDEGAHERFSFLETRSVLSLLALLCS